MEHDEFLAAIEPHLDYKPDSANYDIYKLLPQAEAFELSKLVTLKHIELYDNGATPSELYQQLKQH